MLEEVDMVEEVLENTENQLDTNPLGIQSQEPERIDPEVPVPNIASDKTSREANQRDLKTSEDGDGPKGVSQNNDSDDGASQATTQQQGKSKGALKKERLKRKKELEYKKRMERERVQQEVKEARKKKEETREERRRTSMAENYRELEQAKRNNDNLLQSYASLVAESKSHAEANKSLISQLEAEIETLRTAREQDQERLIAAQSKLEVSEARVWELLKDSVVAQIGEDTFERIEPELQTARERIQDLERIAEQDKAQLQIVQRRLQDLERIVEQDKAEHRKEIEEMKSALDASEQARASATEEPVNYPTTRRWSYSEVEKWCRWKTIEQRTEEEDADRALPAQPDPPAPEQA
ncbi:hypothetical protein F4775DRAFT_597318 [Biscogniauxia sp. FL1348]|nr:hypothetical protein F4775DRAFT_597318 [Biscogniauxia sp. FL1348]